MSPKICKTIGNFKHSPQRGYYEPHLAKKITAMEITNNLNII